MRSLPSVLLIVLLLPGTVALGQSDGDKSDIQKSDAQKSFDRLKTLAGTWRGSVTANPPQADIDRAKPEVTLRVTSRGNAIVHEIKDARAPDDPARNDHPVTMLYLDGDRLYLTHYCDAGNRPRMVARTSPDGETVEFDFVDVSGGTVRAHAPRRVHHHRRQPSHRGLDLHGAWGQAGLRTYGLAASNKVTEGISSKVI